MVDVAGIALRRHHDGRVAQGLAVVRRQRASPRRPARQPGEARAEDRRLDLIEPAVHAELGMAIPVGLAAVAQPLEL